MVVQNTRIPVCATGAAQSALLVPAAQLVDSLMVSSSMFVPFKLSFEPNAKQELFTIPSVLSRCGSGATMVLF